MKAAQGPHMLTRWQFNNLFPNKVHAFEVRNIFEEPVRLFVFGISPKPSLEDLESLFIKVYAEALHENRPTIMIGLCYALTFKEGNYVDEKPIYAGVDKNINCNWTYDKIINHLNEITQA